MELPSEISGEAIIQNPRELYVWVLGFAWSMVHLYAGLRFFDIVILTQLHVMAAISVIFALNPTPHDPIPYLAEQTRRRLVQVLDAILVALPLVIFGYLLFHHERLVTRIPQASEVTTPDMIFGVLAVLLLLESSRRLLGPSLAIIGLLVIAYGFFGHMIPAPFGHSGLDFESLVDLLFLSEEGIFAIPAKISARFVFLFVLFGAVLLESGASDLFLKLAKSIAGQFRGGAAKIAVITSAFMATINGSAVANAVSTGSVTIPMMQKSGYDDESSGAIEAIASTGGQLMPPVMGAAAFILAEISGIPYLEVIIFAAIPSLLFYVGVISSVHFEAAKQDVGRVPLEKLPSIRTSVSETGHLAIPIVLLLWVMFETRSVELAASVTVFATGVIVFARHSTRMDLVGYFQSFRRAAEMVVSSAIPCAIAGILIGVIFMTGVATRITSIILALTGQELMLTLIVVAVISIGLGMGMPTSAAYITVAILAVPALIQLELPRITAHLFGLYFAVISMITPPIALAAFAASSISGGNTWKTGTRAFKMGLPVYLIPFLFVMHPELLTIGDNPLMFAGWFVVASVVVILAAAVGTGFLFEELTTLDRTAVSAGIGIVVFFSTYWWLGAVLIGGGLVRQMTYILTANGMGPSKVMKRL